MSTNNVTPNMTPDQTPPAGAPPTGTPPAQAPSGVGSAITGAGPQGQPPVPTVAPQAPNAAPQAQPQGQPQPAQTPMDAHVNVYRKFLQGFKSPVGSYVDPDGNTRPTNMSLGRMVLASVVAGMMSPTQYRDTPYGPVVNGSATAQGSFAAGQGVVTKAQQDAQAQSDKQQAMKLSNIKNSIDQVHLMAALTQQRHQELQGVLDSNQPAFDDFKAMDDKQADPSKKIILSEPMTFQQAMDSPLYGKGKMTTNSILMTSSRSVYDPETGETHEVPLFTILSPEAGGVTISEDQKKNFSTINRSFDGMGGLDARIPIHQYLVLQGNLTSVQHFQSFIKRADEQLGIKENADLAAAVKKDPTLIYGIRAAENALAQGGSTADTLQRIQHGTDGKVNWNSSALFEAMGLDQDKVAQYIKDQANKDLAAQKVAAEAGKIAEQKAKPITPTTALGIANDPNETPERRQTAQAVIAGQTTLAGSKAGAVAKAREPFELRKQLQEQSLRTGTPEDAGRLLANGDLTLTELKSRGSTPDFIIKATNAAKAIDPHYNAQKADAEYKIAGNQQNTTFFGSANSLLDQGGTLDQLTANYQKLGNTDIPFFNKLEDYAGYQTGDPAMAGFMQTALGVADDYAKVMGGGAGSDTSRVQVLHSFSNAHNPQQMQAAIDAARAAVQSQTRSRIGSNAILQKMYGGTYGSIPPAAAPHQVPNRQPNQPAPPASLLKEGVNTKFKNGQVWTLQSGKAVQVQ